MTGVDRERGSGAWIFTNIMSVDSGRGINCGVELDYEIRRNETNEYSPKQKK